MKTHDVDLTLIKDGRLTGRIVDVTPSKFKAADLVSWSALTLSLVSIALTITTICLTYKNNKLGVMPHLTLGVNSKHFPPMGIWLRNSGVGPAIIKSTEIRLYGKKIESFEALREAYIFGLNLGAASLVFRPVIDGDFYSNNEKYDFLMQAMNMTDDKLLDNIWDKIYSHTEIRIKYCSAYSDCQFVCLDAGPSECGGSIEKIDQAAASAVSAPKSP